MTANTVNGSGNGARSGAQALTLLAVPLNVSILRALARGPQQQAGLRRIAGLPAQTTLRAQLKRLAEIGVVEKHRRNQFPGVLEYELTTAGRDLLSVVDVLERWLSEAPDVPLSFENNAAKAAIKALVESWSTKMLRALAARPLSLTDLDRLIADLSYPALERRLVALRHSSQVEAQPHNGRGTPYALTTWGRQGIAPIAAAAHWERRHLPAVTAPVGRNDAEAAFLLAMPLLGLPAEISGSCRMGVEFPNGGRRRLAGAMVEVKTGSIVSCATQLQGHSDAWALGPPGAWLKAVIEHDSSGLELGGDCRLARSLLEGLHDSLFRPAVQT